MLLESLRTHLLASGLKIGRDDLHVFADDGRIEYTTAPGQLGWRRLFNATVLITDYAGTDVELEYHVLRWMDLHQPDRSDDIALQFSIELLGHDSADIEISLPLSQRISVNTSSGSAVIHYCQDPVPEGVEAIVLPVLANVPPITPAINVPAPPYQCKTQFSADGSIGTYGTAPQSARDSDPVWQIMQINLSTLAAPAYPDGDMNFVHAWDEADGYIYR